MLPHHLTAPALWLALAAGCARPDGASLAPPAPSGSSSGRGSEQPQLAASIATQPSAAAPAPSAEPAAAPGAGPCPPEMAQVGSSCVDKWEAHLVVVAEAGAESVHPHYERPARGVTYKAASAPGVFPQAYINRLESEQACAQAGKRLCTLAEWYTACQGPEGFVFPYGRQHQRGKCNSSKGHLLSRLFGSDPRAWSYERHFNDPKLNQEPGFLARTGEYAGCVSGYGLFDMVGNVHEWVSDRVDAELPRKLPLREDILKKVGPRTGNALFMGGFFSTTHEHGKGCQFVTIGHEAKYHDYSTGLRCCKSQQPAPGG